MENLTEKEKLLWKIAKKRVEFRRHLATYIIMNGFFWCLWYFTDYTKEEYSGIPWPIFPMLGWGIGIAFQYLGAFVFHNRLSSVDKEYEKLKNKSQ